MSIIKNASNATLLSDALSAQGFTRKGAAFFRLQGEGVLVVVKFERQRYGIQLLSLGLHSMYAPMDKSWFTAPGCVLNYSVVNLVGKR